jgi:hypothetical protein
MKRKVGLGAFLLFATSFFALPVTIANASPLYAFTSQTFTPCGATGATGPTLAQCTSAYAASSWTANASYFNDTSGVQAWTVPQSGSYTIVAAGAVGAAGYAGSGGLGAVETGTVNLTQGQSIAIIVGQAGTLATGYDLNGGGGGGSFVVNQANETTTGIFVIAGGGGGGGEHTNGTNVNATTTATGQPGWNGSTQVSLNNSVSSGNGGINYSSSGGGGGGFIGNGGSTTYTGCGAGVGYGGYSFINGGAGGSSSQAGGFGGGGSGDWCDMTGGGGGGGYSGGGGGYYYGSGGGGASYNNGTSQTSSITNSGAGYVTITLNPSTTPLPIALTYSGNSQQFQHTGNLVITATLTGSDGTVTFYYNNKKMFHCVGLLSSSQVATCNWKPSAHGLVAITAYVLPSNSFYIATISAPMYLMIGSRTVTRGT